MKTTFYKIITSFIIFTVTTTSSQANPGPEDLANTLHRYLKANIEWVDVNFNSQSLKMTIRYYPCFPTRAPLDRLINEAIQTTPNYQILQPGKHQSTEGYCVLRDIEFYAVS